MKGVTNNRLSNFEILRLFLMFLILIHHGIVFGPGLSGIREDSTVECVIRRDDFPIMILFNSFSIVAVNTFVLLSGYFKIKLTISKFLNLLFAVLFYTFLFTSIPLLICGDILHGLIRLLPFSATNYWFIREYFFLMFLSPFINSGLETINKKQYCLLIITLLFISCYIGFIYQRSINLDGYNFVNFILLYVIGSYLNTHSFKYTKSTMLLGYVLLSIVICLISVVFLKFSLFEYVWKITYYNNPLVILSSICLFLYFKKLIIQSAIINRISKSALAIYLFSCSSVVFDNTSVLLKIIYISTTWQGVYIFPLLCISIIEIIIALMLDQLRILIWDKIQQKVDFEIFRF